MLMTQGATAVAPEPADHDREGQSQDERAEHVSKDSRSKNWDNRPSIDIYTAQQNWYSRRPASIL